jgi:phosphoglycolate phosphatase
MDKQKAFIFDFDGVIADSGIEGYKIYNSILPSFGITSIDESEIDRFRNLSSRDLIKEVNIPFYKAPFIYLKFKQEYAKSIKCIKPVSEILQVLRKLYDNEVKMYITSSNSEDNIRLFLKKNRMEYFKQIKGGNSFFGKQKAIKKIIKDEKLTPGNTIFIGDETRDVEAARKAGIKAAAVIWGFNTREALVKMKPDYILNKPEDLFLL